MRANYAYFVGCALGLAACTAPAPINEVDIVTTKGGPNWSFMTLGTNDVLRVNVLGHPELSSANDGVRVDPQGGLHLPVVGRVSVQGMSVEEVNTEIHRAYSRYMLKPDVTATVLEYGPRNFHVLGNVLDPGTKLMDRPINALEGLAQGGAFARGADRASIFLLRPHGEVFEVHAFNAETPGREGLVWIRPGDILYVRQRGTQDFQEDLLPILAMFGGTTLHAVHLANDG